MAWLVIIHREICILIGQYVQLINILKSIFKQCHPLLLFKLKAYSCSYSAFVKVQIKVQINYHYVLLNAHN